MLLFRPKRNPRWYTLCLNMIEHIEFIIPNTIPPPPPSHIYFTYVRKGRLRWTYYRFWKFLKHDNIDVRVLYIPILDNVNILTKMLITYHKANIINRSDHKLLECLYRTIEYKLGPFIIDRKEYFETLHILSFFVRCIDI
jgi:hypothetical protein